MFRVMATALALAASVPAHAQGCAMCYNDAAAAKSTAIQALRSGTLILLFPVLLLFAGILVMAFRNRNRFNEAERAPAFAKGNLAAASGTEEWKDLVRAEELELIAASRQESGLND